MKTLSDDDSLDEQGNEHLLPLQSLTRCKNWINTQGSIPVRWVGSSINCCLPDLNVMASVFRPSKDVE